MGYYIYIMSNRANGVLYIGVTNNLDARVQEHKTKVFKKSFTARYNCDKLVYFEEHKNGAEASIREKQMKKWKREWKVNLIEDMNPDWFDLSINWNSEDLIYKTNRFPFKENM